MESFEKTIKNCNLFRDTNFNNQLFVSAGQIHKEIKGLVLEKLRKEEGNNLLLLDLAKYIEFLVKDKTCKFVNQYNKQLKNDNEEGFKKIENYGLAFPVGLSINEVAAHWTPSFSEKRTLKEDDLIKIDFGVHLDGCIADSAFTFSYSNKYNELLKVGREATDLGIKNSGAGAILGEIGKEVQEFIESKEIEIDSKKYNLKSIRDLTGHKILPYMIHADKSVPNFACNYPVRMEDGEFYAIETYPTTGSGKVEQDLEVSHYAVNNELLVKEYREINMIGKENEMTGGKIKNFIRLDKRENFLWKDIMSFRDTLPFCNRWLKERGVKNYQLPLKSLVNKNRIVSYPPLKDIKGSYVCQFEDTIYIRESGCVVLTS